MNKVFGIVLIIISLGMVCVGQYLVLNSKKYTVKFTNVDKDYVIEVDKNGYIRKPDDPTKSGYTFIGWYYNDKVFNFNNKVNENMILVAKWSDSGGNIQSEKEETSLSTSIWNIIKDKLNIQ